MLSNLLQCTYLSQDKLELICYWVAAAKRTVYNTHEQELYNGLAALINDAKSVRVHLAKAMRIQAQAFGSAVAI